MKDYIPSNKESKENDQVKVKFEGKQSLVRQEKLKQ